MRIAASTFAFVVVAVNLAAAGSSQAAAGPFAAERQVQTRLAITCVAWAYRVENGDAHRVCIQYGKRATRPWAR